ncbi:MAG: SDR family oxidoreductase [Pseudomonadota bacterium]|nr:SDR family oxidoreductase [Pseudomonadota bacterium]
MSDNRVALVTGAGGGLGGAMTEALAVAGYRVAALDVSEELAKQTAMKRPDLADSILPIGGDVRSPVACQDAITQTVENFGALHMLVNNAGIGQSSIREDYYVDNIMFWDVPDKNWENVLDTNVKGAFLMAKAAISHLQNAEWGRIVNVTTSLDTMIRRGWTPYGPSKAALEACSAVWAKDLEGSPVSVNVLVPGGPANTGMVPAASAGNREALVQPAIMKTPIVWLASNSSDGFTGRRIVATEWDQMLPDREAAQKASWPAAWPGLGAQAIVAEGNPMEGS